MNRQRKNRRRAVLSDDLFGRVGGFSTVRTANTDGRKLPATGELQAARTARAAANGGFRIIAKPTILSPLTAWEIFCRTDNYPHRKVSITPFEQAHDFHAGLRSKWQFHQVIEKHALHGYVVITPTVFWLARRVWHDWPDDRLCDLYEVAEDGDCWHVWLAAGDWSGWQDWIPTWLPWVSYHRRGQLRVRRLEKFA